MSTQKRNQLKEIMSLAWSFVRKNGYTMSEALKVAWLNMKLKTGRKTNDTLFTYFDTERGEYRSFKRANLLSIGELKVTQS